MRRQPSCLVTGAVLLLLVGCGEDQVQTTGATAASPTPTSPPPAAQFCKLSLPAVEARIDALLPQMTLAEKVDQMHGRGDVGSINGLWYTPDNERLGIPGFHMVDGPRGVSRG